MAPAKKAAGSGGSKGARAIPEGGVTVLGCCDCIKGNCGPIINEITGHPVRKIDAAAKLWTHALKGEKQKEEILKGQPLSALVLLLERGSPEERMAACGLLYTLAQSTKHTMEVVSNRVIMGVVMLLGGEHDRSRQPAAQFLAFLAQRPEYSARVADNALLLLLEGCKAGSVPGWGGARLTALHCVTAIRALIENVQCEALEPKVLRRNVLVEHGAVAALAQLLAYTPRLPEPAKVPAAPPAAVGKGAKGKGARGRSASRKGKGGADGDRLAAGRKDCIATQAAACLRFLALCPHFMPELLASGRLEMLVTSLPTASDEQAAFVCGILWEATGDLAVAQQVLRFNGVPILLHVVSTCLVNAEGKGKKKAKPKAADARPAAAGRIDRNAMPPPPNYPDIAVCNAAGALHHVTFLDAAKTQVGQAGGTAILALCLKAAEMQTVENATGALWNLGLDRTNVEALQRAGLPAYLARPMPLHWLVEDEEDDGDRESFFITQAS